MCKKPFMKNMRPFPCGQCMHCRINRQRIWAHRMLLEMKSHDKSSFVTLTYDDQHLPEGGTLVPKHLTDWLKRFRRRISPDTVRYFAVGEYGDASQRPHYHLALFGANFLDSGVIRETWSNGGVHVGDLTPQSASYICGYILKRRTNDSDEYTRGWLNGRHPEFSRMSLRPGIGALSLDPIRDALETEHGCDRLSDDGDVPHELKIGQKSLMLGRYLRGQLREKMGMQKMQPLEKQKEHSLQMQALYEENRKSIYETPKETFLRINKQKRLNKQKKYEIYEQRRKL
jgi:hypothetical protein